LGRWFKLEAEEGFERQGGRKSRSENGSTICLTFFRQKVVENVILADLQLTWIKARLLLIMTRFLMAEWKPISTAPLDCELELAVIEGHADVHALVFPCRRTFHGWINALTQHPVVVHPTHWRQWRQAG
jgi:hypothetical protein